MKHLKLFFALFAMLALGVGNAWGAETDTYDFKTNGVTKVSGPNSGNVTSSSGSVVLKSKTGNTTDTWTIIFTGSTAYGYGKNTGIYFGTNSYAPNAQMTSKSYNYVSQVDIVTTTTNTSYNIGVKVGGSSFGEKTLGSCTSQTQTFTSDATTGAITISVTSSNKKQVKIEKVIITYGSAPATPDPVDPTATFSNGSYTVGQTLDLSTLWTSNSDGAVTYSIVEAGTTGASINGKSFTASAAGTCTVKASQAATSAYNAIEKTATITVTAPTPATITLSEAGQEKTVEGYVGDSYELPLTSTQTCGTKTFVGWSTVEIATPGDKPTSNFYEPGTTVTLAAEQTFYAVFATGSGTPETWEQTTSVAVGDQVIIAQVDNGTKEMTGLGKTPETANNNYGVGTDFTTNPNGTLIWTVEEGNTSGQFSFNNGTYYLNLGANENYLSYSATKTATSSWTVSTSDERAVVTNANYDSRKIMWNKSSTRFASYSKNHGSNSGQYYYHIVFYKKSGGISYSDYTTSCAAAPEPAVLVSIAANAEDNNEFTEGDAFVKAIITATYDDATTKDVTEEATFTGYDMSTPGEQTVTVEYEGKTTTYTITVTAKPAATLTLSKNNDTSEKIVGKVGDVINLPTFTSDCSKTFVGWDADENCNHAPTYAPGAEFELTATEHTLYAVYATAAEGELTSIFSETFDACDGTGGNDGKWSGNGVAQGDLPDELSSTWTFIKGTKANECAKFGTGSLKGSAETPEIALSGSAKLTFKSGAWDGNSENTTINVSATGATLSPTSVTLDKGIWNAYTIDITEATGSVKIKFEAKVDNSNRFFLDDVVVSQGSITYSDYSTTCAVAPDAPEFSVAAGTYNAAQTVTITAEDGATIYYTLDGNNPTNESNVYSSALTISETTTLKAIAVKDGIASTVTTATYTINLPLTTMDQIFAKASDVKSTATPVEITFGNWVVSAVKEDGKTAYLTDGTKGLIIYTASHGFNVGDILSGTVACKVQLFKGSAELTELTSTTSGLAVTTGGTVTPVTLDAAGITALTGVNTGSVIKINGVHESDNIVNNVKLYNTLFSFENLTPGQEYNVTGVYLQYDATKEILPRSAADIEEVVGLPTATISIENITLVEGDEHTIVATITPDEAASKVTYSIKNGDEYISLSGNVITANAVGTATITAAIAEVDGVYHGTTKDFTVTVKEYVAPISGTWELVTDASKLQAGMEVIVAQYVEEDGTIYTMGGQKTSNRDVVESSVLGKTLTPTTGTTVLTLVDAGNGTFALQAGNGNYLYAASSTANQLKEKNKIDVNGQWTITIADNVATIKAEGSSNRNWMQFNPNNGSPLFSCYAYDKPQKDIALYARVPDHTRTTSAGRYGTICLPGNIVKCLGATLYEVAGKDGLRVVFDEVLTPEAGMPYIFLAHNAEVLFYCGDQTAAAGNYNSLYGTFSVLQDAQLDGMYMVQNNKIVKCAATGCGVAENRAYFNGAELEALGSAPAPMPGRRRITMATESENTTTGTEDVIAPEGQTLKLIENGQLVIIRNGEKFNAQGIKF